jgi:tetratricopeptide (TPR) repeat protein
MAEAIAEFHTAIRLQPDLAEAHYNLGYALWRKSQLDEGIAELREAIRLKPDHTIAHWELGHALRKKGRYPEALAAYRRGHEMGSKQPEQPGWPTPWREFLRKCERAVAIEPRFAAMIKGEAHPADIAERLTLAEMCHDKAMSAAAARFWCGVFKADPLLAEDLKAANRYSAACDAALAGSGRGKDEPPPDEKDRADLRSQAREWLRADLVLRSKQLDNGTPQARRDVEKKLAYWKTDPDLAGIRDESELKKLPEGEQTVCRALWSEVEALLAKARTGTSP